jgi:hypothetical protein
MNNSYLQDLISLSKSKCYDAKDCPIFQTIDPYLSSVVRKTSFAVAA